MKKMLHGHTPRGHLLALTETGVNRHDLFHQYPSKRSVSDVLNRASELEKQLPNRVLPFEEDWDLVILAREIKRLRLMIDVP